MMELPKGAFSILARVHISSHLDHGHEVTVNGGGVRGVMGQRPGGLAGHNGLPPDVQQLTTIRPCEVFGDVV